MYEELDEEVDNVAENIIPVLVPDIDLQDDCNTNQTPERNASNNLKRKRKAKEQTSNFELEEMAILWSVSNSCQLAQQRDSFDIFGEYIASKLRKLSTTLDEDLMEDIQHEITCVIQNHRKKHKENSEAILRNLLSQIPPACTNFQTNVYDPV